MLGMGKYLWGDHELDMHTPTLVIKKWVIKDEGKTPPIKGGIFIMEKKLVKWFMRYVAYVISLVEFDIVFGQLT
jgi:hypothetical protein